MFPSVKEHLIPALAVCGEPSPALLCAVLRLPLPFLGRPDVSRKPNRGKSKTAPQESLNGPDLAWDPEGNSRGRQTHSKWIELARKPTFVGGSQLAQKTGKPPPKNDRTPESLSPQCSEWPELYRKEQNV